MVNALKLSRAEAILAGQKVYWRESSCKAGHYGWFRLSGGCVECQKETSRRYKERHKEALKEKQLIYLSTDHAKAVKEKYMAEKGRKLKSEWVKNKRKKDPAFAEKARELNRKYREKNLYALNEKRKSRESCPIVKAKIKETSDKWRKKNAEKLREERREYYRLYMAERRKNDPSYKCLSRMRDFVRRSTEAARGIKNWRTCEALGYSPKDFKIHIESLWLDGMSWDNYGEWHIDHIQSIKSLIDKGVTDARSINSLANLQPLWAFDNLSKGAG